MQQNFISCPRDLTKVKSKVVFNLTRRQIIGFSVAALLGVPSFFLIKAHADVNTAVMSMIVIMMPVFFFTMYEKNGRPLEVYLGHFIQAVFIRPKKRPYKTDNYYAAVTRLSKVRKEIDRIVRTSAKKK
ncbi:MAG: PrgI family protein [Butyrivibrio sp.]|nr:PrgI family protein [Butyrivibrio sp.]